MNSIAPSARGGRSSRRPRRRSSSARSRRMGGGPRAARMARWRSCRYPRRGKAPWAKQGRAKWRRAKWRRATCGHRCPASSEASRSPSREGFGLASRGMPRAIASRSRTPARCASSTRAARNSCARLREAGERSAWSSGMRPTASRPSLGRIVRWRPSMSSEACGARIARASGSPAASRPRTARVAGSSGPSRGPS